MNIYGGLSGVNVGLLVFLACRGWQRNLLDWFWPAVLVIHVVEVFLEIHNHGTGGGGRVLEEDVKSYVKRVLASGSTGGGAGISQPNLPDFTK